MDWHKLQNTLFELDPTDPREDFAKMNAQAQGGAASVAPQETVDYLNESAEVEAGSLELDRDYSVSDFAALAGVVSEGPALDAFKTGYKDPTIGGIKSAAASYSKPSKADKSSAKDAKEPQQKTSPAASADDWKGFLKQHTAQLKTIAADPKKKAHFDKYMASVAEDFQYEETNVDTSLEARVAQLEAMLEVQKQPNLKPRDPSAQYMNDLRKSGAMGAHKDKKKDAKAGKVKHKGKAYESIADELWAMLKEK